MKGSIKIVFFVFCFLISIMASAQIVSNFEGELRYMKRTKTDTSFTIFRTKERKVRLDELNNKKQLINYWVINLNNPSVYAFNPKRKLYKSSPIFPWTKEQTDTTLQIIKTGNYKGISGYKCYQWRVKDFNNNIEITFWVVLDKFSFFYEIHRILNKDTEISHYFLQIPGAQNALPMEIVERSLLREFISQINLTAIRKTSINSNIFDVPANYKPFE